jgi:glycosyltransferase involved in cell wall biosynthesis
VLFLHSATQPPLGADTWVQSQIISALDKSRIDVHVACAFGSAAETTPTFDVMRALPGIRLVPVDLGRERSSSVGRGRISAWITSMPSLPSFVKLALYARRERVAIIHTTDRPRDAFASVVLSRLTRSSCIVHAHVGFDANWMSAMLQWSMKRADGLIAISEFVASTLIAGGHDPARVHVVRNALDIPRWTPGVGRDERRLEFSISSNETVVLTVCRLFPAKGPTALIHAFAKVHAERPDIRLLVVGREMEPGYLAELMELVVDLGIEAQVIFTGPRNDVPTLMAAADIYAMPSLYEPFGLVFLEAMAMELPVIALNNGGTVEVVDDGVGGLLSAPDDLDALTENLRTLVDDPDRRHKMGRYGRTQVESRFTVDRMAREIEEVYWLLASVPRERAER